MAEGIDSSSWLLELESALFSEGDFNNVRRISNGKPVPPNLRATFWQVCLGVREKHNTLSHWFDVYDLAEQAIIRSDCQKLVDKLGNEEEDKVSVVSDLESVVTNYCKATSLTYQSNNGWLDVLEPLIALRLNKFELYNCFYAIQASYIPRYCDKNGHLFHLLRLLLLYHDPELCSFLDTKKIMPDLFARKWFQSLFSSTCDLEVTLSMWDIYFQLADPFFVFFLALVILVNAKEDLLSMKNESKQGILDSLCSAPCALVAEDVEDFCGLAKFYASRTPLSFSRDYHLLVFGEEGGETENTKLSQALCLPISVQELLLGKKNDLDKGNQVRYFVVDCRPAEQYNAGYLSTAFHLDSSLMLSEPAAFRTAVQSLLAFQRQSVLSNSVAGGEHLCFMGSGREEEDQYVHMVVASFLQKNLNYVSLAKGGYNALHELLTEDDLKVLTNHNSKHCIVCSPAVGSNDGGAKDEEISLMDKLTSAVRSKTTVVKGMLVEYITNPQQPAEERHVSSSDRLGKRYRAVAPIFSIDDDQEDGGQLASEDELVEEVVVKTWLQKSDLVSSYKCQEVKDNGSFHESLLVVTPTHLYLLREIPHKRQHAFVVARRSLSSIVKITSKKRCPEFITLKYGHVRDTGDFEVTAMDRVVIPDASEATKIIKEQIQSLRNESEK